MISYSFIPPLCLNCRVSLEQRVEYDQEKKANLNISFCPICQEIYHKMQ